MRGIERRGRDRERQNYRDKERGRKKIKRRIDQVTSEGAAVI